MHDHASVLRNCAANYYLSAFVPFITRYMFHVKSCICVKLNHSSALRKSVYLPRAKSYMSIKHIYESHLYVFNMRGRAILGHATATRTLTHMRHSP